MNIGFCIAIVYGGLAILFCILEKLPNSKDDHGYG